MDGAFSFAELLLQRIWARGDFDHREAKTMTGEVVRVLRVGRWNRQGGPDFRGARVEIGGRSVIGDVEIHLRAGDWRAHGHRQDPRYAEVVLHVVLFPGNDVRAVRADGFEIPTLVLLPLLYRSLEEHAEDDAVERLANHPLRHAQETLLGLGQDELQRQLLVCSEARWTQKVGFARARVSKLGWEGACHQTALEVLGYRFNRGPMLAVAAEHPLHWWRANGRPGEVLAVYELNRDRWYRQAVRPANHPRTRLLQYAAWVARRPSWPARLEELTLPSLNAPPGGGVANIRKRAKLPDLRAAISETVIGNVLGGSRQETLTCDGFLPLLAAKRPDQESQIGLLWSVWYPGDVPENLMKLLRSLSLGGRSGWRVSHGVVQGLLAWVWREEERSDQTAACL